VAWAEAAAVAWAEAVVVAWAVVAVWAEAPDDRPEAKIQSS
jgi:hypothetical protein